MLLDDRSVEKLLASLCSLLIVVLCLLKGLGKLWQHRRHIADALWKFLHICRAKRASTGPSETFLRSEVCKLQLDFARTYLGIVAAVLCLCLLSGIARMWGSGPHAAQAFIATNVAFWNLAVLGLLVAGALWAPCALTARTLGLWNLIFHLHILVFLSPGAIPAWAVFSGRVFSLVVIQLPCMIYVQNMPVAFLCYLCIPVFVFLRSLTADPEDSAGTVLGYPVTIAAAEIFLFPCISTLVGFVHKMFQQKVEARIRESDAASQLDAASALLRLTCDAVIELDNELRLIDHCPKLAGMLLRRASLQGACFTDLISRADVLRAKEHLLGNVPANSTSCSFANAFHTHLVDSCSSKFRTEVFQVKYQMSNNELRHLIGLRDFTDVKSLAGCKATDAMHDDVDLDEFEPYTVGARTHEGAGSTPREVDGHGPSRSLSSYAMDSDSESTSFADSRENLEHGVVEQVIKLKRKNIFLELDMQAMQICAAGAPVAGLVGRPLWEVFMSDYTVDLCLRLLAQAQQVPFLPDTAVSFERMPIFCAPRTIEATGTMHVVQTSSGVLKVILIFRPDVDQIQL
ncbi:unnamed protein product [Effrenium voratum]|nr:unnamed protein product [Effrenium voratum]